MHRMLVTTFATLLCGGIALLAEPAKPASPAKTTTTAAASKPKSPLDQIAPKEIDAITYEDSEEDTGFITPVAADLDHMDEESKKRLDDWTAKLHDWAGSKEENVPQRV